MSLIDSKENDKRVLLKLKQTEPGFYKSIGRMSKSHDKLTKENAGLRSKLGRVQKENRKQTQVISMLKEGLEFYGDVKNWTIDYHTYEEEREEIERGEFAQTIRNDCDPVDTSTMQGTYGGKTAREALKKTEEILGGGK